MNNLKIFDILKSETKEYGIQSEEDESLLNEFVVRKNDQYSAVGELLSDKDGHKILSYKKLVEEGKFKRCMCALTELRKHEVTRKKYVVHYFKCNGCGHTSRIKSSHKDSVDEWVRTN